MEKQKFTQKISRALPKWITESQIYNWARLLILLRFRHGGTLVWNREVSSWVATRTFGGKEGMSVVIRSFKELRRIIQFGRNKNDIVYRWLHIIKDCKYFYDIGAANGLEGFLCHNLHGSKICFVEPYTPSIETIMRNVFVLAKRGLDPKTFEIVHAGCGKTSHYDKAYMLCIPKAGETRISFSDPDGYERRGQTFSPVVTQWVYGVSVDDLNSKYGVGLPTHVKIDVDGFENRVIEGAEKLIESGHVESWAIEITGEKNLAEIDGVMRKYGYVEVDRWEHYPGLPARTFDVIYSKPEKLDYYKKALSTF